MFELTHRSRGALRRPARWAACLAAAGVLSGVLAASSALDARAQTAESDTAGAPSRAEKSSEDEFRRPMGPADPYNRGTPRGSVYGYVLACRHSDYERAAKYLDLRRLPPEDRERGAEIARQLREALGPVLEVDFTNLSDTNDGTPDDGLPAWQDRLGSIETEEGLVPILMQRVPRAEDGVRIWKFSSETVGMTQRLYDEYGPGLLESVLPEFFFDHRVFRIQLAQWVGLFGSVLVAWVVSLMLAGTATRIFGRLVTQRGQALDERIVAVMRGPVHLIATIIGFEIGTRYLALDRHVEDVLRLAEILLLIIAVTWLIHRVIDIAALGLRKQAEDKGNLGLLPALRPLQRITNIVVLVLAFLAALGVMGVNVTAAIAGLGVGGIAVALAAQKTLENLFGGASLFADQPVRVGDFCRYGDQLGTVEEIGLRSTRVRTLDRTLVSVPNADFSNMRLENFALRDQIRLWTMLGVRYETTADQLRYLLTSIREILLAHPRVTDDPARVRFVGFGAYSLDIEVFAYVNTNDWSEFLGVREDIYLRFIDAVNEAGTSFAFPSSTMYLGRDDGVSEESTRRAEEQVAKWREQGELPFPDFPEDQRREVWNSGDWPPQGSPRGLGD